MKAREAVLRLKRFEAEEKARKVTELEHMIHEFELMAGELERQVHAEEDRTGISDKNHFAYSTFARSAAQRRENLMVSLESLQNQLDQAIAARDEVLAEIGDVEPVRDSRSVGLENADLISR